MSSQSKRGRPRDQGARKKILAAARALLDEGGISAVTMEAVAQKAGVGKPTIYRDWPNAQAVAMAAFLETAQPLAESRAARGPLEALRLQLRKVAEAFATRVGRNTAMMIAAAQNDSELAKVFRNHFILKSREDGRLMLTAAVENGELRAGIDLETALDLIYAPLYFRLLIGHGALDGRFTDQILDNALEGLRVREKPVKPKPRATSRPARGKRMTKPTTSSRG